MNLVANNDGSSARFELNVPQKAVLSATLQLRKTEGQVDPNVGLGKAVISNLQDFSDDCIKAKCFCGTVIVESRDSSENLKALFDSSVPSKLRGVALNGPVCSYIDWVAKSFKGKWAVIQNGAAVHYFTLDDTPDYQAREVVGTTLYRLVKERFKLVPENDSLNLKARGTHLKPGDYADLTFWVLVLDTPDRGKAVKFDLRLNFVNWTVSGTSQSFDMQHADRERTDPVHERESQSEDYCEEYSDYDDYEHER